VWAVSAGNVKRDVESRRFRNQKISILIMRIAAVCIVVWLIGELASGRLGSQFTHRPFLNNFSSIPQTFFQNPTTNFIGVLFCVLGIGFAVWARFHLGREWSSHPTVKEGHQLITSGPYAYVRHPIYTGILLAVLGSALATGIYWIIYFLIILIVFLRRVKIEEQLMTKMFPDQYPKYKARTKALIPFIW